MDNQTNYSQEFISKLNNAPTKKSFFSNKLVLISVVLAGITIIFGGAGLVISILANSGPKVEDLSKHVQAVTAISRKYNKDLSNSALRSVNGNLQLVLVNFNRELSNFTIEVDSQGKPVASKTTKIDPITLLPAADLALEDAKLNAVLDRSFVNEINYLIDQEIIMIQRLSAKHQSNKALSKVLKKAFDDLTEFKTQLTSLNLA